MSGEENIYMNPYPATREFGWRVKYIFLKWKGSVFRLMWKELAIYMSLYFFISMTYRLLLAQYPTAKHNFELFCVHCSFHIYPTAVAILTGFYVSNVVHRYWEQFMAIPWPDQLALKLVAFIPCEVCASFQKDLSKDFDFWISFRTFSGKRQWREKGFQKKTKESCHSICKPVNHLSFAKDITKCPWKIPRF